MSKEIAKILSGLLIFGMVAGLVPAIPGGTVHANAAEPHTSHCVCGKGEHTNNGHDYKEETWTGIKNDEQLKNITADGHYYLENDVEIDSEWNCPNGVTLCLNGHNITRKGNDEQNLHGWNAVIKINSGTTFTLTDCQDKVGTITHAKDPYSEGVYKGEGVYNAGKFIMYNGMISGNNYAGVHTENCFIMYDGKICNNKNTAGAGGGVYVSGNESECSFEMHGGEIFENNTNNGAGVFIQGTKVAMTGGTIYNNKSTKGGGGVYICGGTFEMSGGEISNNVTTNFGGGVYKQKGTFTMSGDSTITQNRSQSSGGGVYNQQNEFTMSGGKITGNESQTYGGGVYNLGKFTMSGGEITGNESKMSGGGVYNVSTGSFKMSDIAVISNNKAAGLGGGVYLAEDTVITLGGAIKITGNTVGDNRVNNLYLGRETTVQTDSLTGKETIGVTAYDTPTDDSLVTITSDAASAGCFFSDNSNYEIGTDTDGKVVLKKTATCNVRVYIPDNGSIIHITNFGGLIQRVTKGNNIEPIILEAGEGYYFSDADISNLTRDGIITTKQADGRIKIEGTPNSDISLTASASEKPDTAHTITATVSGENGSISPSGSVNVKEGESQVFTITPNEGYEIASLKVDGAEVTNPSKTYTFTKVTSNHTIEVSFKEQAVVPPAIEVPVITTQPQPEFVKAGEAATFTVEAAGSGLKYQWQVNKNDNAEFVDIVGANSESYTLNAVSKDCNGYQYQCVVSNQSGSVTSASVILTVTENSTPEPDPNPTPNPEPEPTPTPTPEPSPTPTPNPTPEATTPTPDSAPATSTPAASTTTALAATAPAPVTYDILDGAGSSWTQNTDGSLAIRGSGEISKFREVKVDGVTVDPVNYTVTEGSTIITFKPEYLKSLSAGNHSFELVWTDGTAATNFTVAENADQSAKSPKTGEDFSMALCTALLMISCAGLAGIFAKRKRNHAR